MPRRSHAGNVIVRGIGAWLSLGLVLGSVLAGPAPGVAAGPTVGGTPVFPADNIWNRTVTDLPVHPDSTAYLNNIGLSAALKADFGSGLWNGGPIGIPYVVVGGGQPNVAITYTAYGDESDPGPFPIPPNAPIEGGSASTGDRHVLVVDKDNGVLYELYRTFPNGNGSWNAESGARYDLNANVLRPDGWTSADAAGLPIFPGLARYDEVAAGTIAHALRFTVPRTQKQHIWPARHDASSSTDPTRPPMGLRLRLKVGVNISGYPTQARVVLQALKEYGMILADNGSALYISGAPDERWNNSDLASLRAITANDFEVVDTGGVMIDADSAQALQPGGGGGPAAGAPAWYFAEGYTGSGFDEYLTIQNPNGAAAAVRITYMLRGGSTIVRTLTVAGNSRSTVAVHDTAQGVGRNQEVAAKVESTNGVGIIVERPMYFPYQGSIPGGHVVLGATAPRAAWYFAEGYTGTGFDEYLTIMNPNASPAAVTITYFLTGAPPVTTSLTVTATARETVIVHDTARGVGRGQAVSARVTTTHAGGIVVERPMYFRYGSLAEGHTVMGAPAPGPTWFFPEGATTTGTDTYLTIMNPNADPAAVTLTYYVVGETAPRTAGLSVPANQRATVQVHDTTLGVGRGKLVASQVTTTHAGGIVVERPVYAPAGATTVLGAPVARPAWYFAEGYTGAGFAEDLTILNPNATAATVTLTYFLPGGGTITRQTSVPALNRITVVVNDTTLGAGPNRAVAARVETTHPGGVVAERVMRFTYAGTIPGAHAALGYAP